MAIFQKHLRPNTIIHEQNDLVRSAIGCMPVGDTKINKLTNKPTKTLLLELMAGVR